MATVLKRVNLSVRFLDLARLTFGQPLCDGRVMNENLTPAATLAALSAAGQTASTHLSDPECWVEEYGDYLFKYALVRLRDSTKAEDMVQETFLAALRGGNKFGGRSAERGWLVAILKHKILDYYRKSNRETSFTDLDFYSDEESDRFTPDGLSAGGWVHQLGPMEWPSDPGAGLDSQAFWKIFHDCSSKLPVNVSAVFTMREVDGIESKEICKLLNISESNLWVMLHRARMALRRCLETNWFGKQT